MLFEILFLLAFGFLAWGLLCNQAAYNNRHRLIDAIFDEDDCHELAKLFQVVSYDSEVNSRLFLRDWRKLYPTELRERFPHLFS